MGKDIDSSAEGRATARRKRGDELEQVIFASAVNILEKKGYEEVTFQNIAREAKTGRAVLYRRWATPFQLLYDAVHSQILGNRGSLVEKVIDNGSLRADLIEALSHFINSEKLFSGEFLRAFIYEMGQSNATVKEIFKNVRLSNLLIMEKIINKAMIRKELTHPVSDYVKLMPFELIRYEMIINQNDLTKEFIEQLVDEVVLPAFLAGHHACTAD